MYCLTFTEIGLESKNFFFHSYNKAIELQRQLIIIEINELVKWQTDEGPFKFDEVHNSVLGEFRDAKMSNYELYRLLITMLKMSHKDEWEQHIINIEINDILFEDQTEVILI
jgi:hypothetical protein